MNVGSWNDWSEAQRLAFLQEAVAWSGVDPHDKFRLLEREVDSSRVTPEEREMILVQDGELDHEGFEPNEAQGIRPHTQQLIDCCALGVWPGNATVIDFGLDTSNHRGALQYAIREELVTQQELDAAMGSGDKLTEIARRGENPYRDVTFKTSWDEMLIVPDSTPARDSYARQLDELISRTSDRDKDRGGPER